MTDINAQRLAWLHSAGSYNVDGYEWGIYRVKWENGKAVEVWQTNADFSDLDSAAGLATPPRAGSETTASASVQGVMGAEVVAEPRKRIRLDVSREWLLEKLAQGDDSECGAGFELMPEARAASDGESLRLALEQERQKFQQETRRTSELMVLLRRWVERHVAEHGPGPWARSCDVCALVGESQALLEKPINAAPPGLAQAIIERLTGERDVAWGEAADIRQAWNDAEDEMAAQKVDVGR
jgi:hypothetical protein